MAYMQVNFRSTALNRIVTFNALLPMEEMTIPGWPEHKEPPFKSLYLLHGYSGNHNDMLMGTNISDLSMKYGLAVFTPAAENSFYLDDKASGYHYSKFIGEELLDFTRKLFPVSDKREDTFIGGFSMGGYGAIRNGLKYHDRFSRIISLSSALITDSIADIKPGHVDEVADYDYYSSTFGDLNELPGSDKDPNALVRQVVERGKDIPELFMACGTEDFLLENNRKFHKTLEQEGLEHIYIEKSGSHEWSFVNGIMEDAVKWVVE